MFQYTADSPTWATLVEMSSVTFRYIIYSNCLIRLNKFSNYNDFQRYLKIQLKHTHKKTLKCIKMQIWHWR